MKQAFVVALLATMFNSHVALAQFSLLGAGFKAPTIKDKDDVEWPEIGEIVYDSSESLFYGRIHDNVNNVDAWAALSGGGSASNPIGTVITFAGAGCPTGYLPADGKTYPRTGIYGDLFDVILETHGNGTVGETGADDCPAPTGCFNVPDYRGRFLRGVDGSAGRDPDTTTSDRPAMNPGGNAGNAVGSVQADEFKSHFHELYAGNNTAVAAGSSGSMGPNSSGTGFNTTTRGGDETRPKNAYVNFCVKY